VVRSEVMIRHVSADAGDAPCLRCASSLVLPQSSRA
jgi:hypothetical protein